jgi:hypothetical protein
MTPRRVKIWRGGVWLGETAEQILENQAAFRYSADQRLEQAFEAGPPLAAPAFAAVRNACQTASGGSYFVFLGASYRPAPGAGLRLSVGVSSGAGGLPAEHAMLVLFNLGESIERWASRPSGEIVVEHALVHEVDSKEWAWRGAASLVGALLNPDNALLDDAQVAALASGVFQASRR